MNPLYLTPIALIIVAILADRAVRKRAFEHVQALYNEGRSEELLAYLDGRYARLLFPVFNRRYLQFKAHAQAHDEKCALHALDELLAMRLTNEQRSELLVTAFEYYLGHGKGDKARHVVKLVAEAEGGQQAAAELKKVYEIVAEHSHAYVDEMEAALAGADKETARRLHYLLALQYDSAGDAAAAERHRKLMGRTKK